MIFETVTGDRFASAARLASGAAHDVTIAALPLLDAAVPDGSPVVVNIASMYGSVSPDPRVYDTPAEQNPADYGAAKAGLLQYTRHAAVHLAPRGIRVNSISPGPFPSAARDELVARLAARVPIGRIGTPEELHTALLFLASPASSYVTGADIPVDGGWTAWCAARRFETTR